jgi:hypothetical protein
MQRLDRLVPEAAQAGIAYQAALYKAWQASVMAQLSHPNGDGGRSDTDA